MMTLEEFEAIKDGYRRFGQWAGNPRGNAEDITRCIREVWPSSGSFISRQCLKKRGHGRDGLYCKQHGVKP